MKINIQYSEITKIVKQQTDVDVTIDYDYKNEEYPLQIMFCANLPVIGKYNISAKVNLIYEKEHLFIFYNIGFIYKALLPKVVDYLIKNGYENYFIWKEDKQLFIINFMNIEVIKQILTYVTINSVKFDKEINTDFSVDIKK